MGVQLLLVPFLLFFATCFTSANTLRDDYDREGFVVVEDFLSAEECATMMKRMDELVEAWDPNENELSIFRTDDAQIKAQGSDNYFLDSADKIHFFLEPGATDNITGKIKPGIDKALALNKVGHGLHVIDPIFREYTLSQKLGELVHTLGMVDPVAPQSMYIFKQPFYGGEVTPHQDSTFLWTEPRQTCMGLWLALEDANEENGCLWARPGSHLDPVTKQFARNPHYSNSTGGESEPLMIFRDIAVENMMEVSVSMEVENMENNLLVNKDAIEVKVETLDSNSMKAPSKQTSPDSQFVPLKMKRGSLVAFPGSLEHFSRENISPKSRHTFQLHIVEGPGAGVEWSPSNWLQYKDGKPFLKLFKP